MEKEHKIDSPWIKSGRKQMPLIRPPSAAFRATLIAEHLEQGQPLVCFTSGDAGKELQRVGVRPLCVGPNEALMPGRWWSPAEIRRQWPEHFDAPPGHLPICMVVELGHRLARVLGDLPKRVAIPAGSGETLLAMAWAYPEIELYGVINLDPNSEHHDKSPLAPAVASVCAGVWDASRRSVHLIDPPEVEPGR